MFQSDFQEGAALATNETCRVPLPDDDSKAMHTLCLVLHYQSDNITHEINTGLLHNIAVLADKYACSGAISRWARISIIELMERPEEDSHEFARLLYPAIVFDAPKTFGIISKRLVYSYYHEEIASNKKAPFNTWKLSKDVQLMLPDGLLG